MLADWQCVQQYVWALEAEVRHIQASTDDVLSRLEKLQSYRCELRLAIRQLRRSSNASQVGWAKDSGLSLPLGLEKVASAESADAWASFLRQLAQRPEAICSLARAAGPQSYELLALFAAALAEEAPVATLHRALSERVLEKIVSTELEAYLESQPPGAELQASSLLASGSFLGELCMVLTAQDPACMAWGQGVLHREVRVKEAVRQLVTVSPGTGGSSTEGVEEDSQEARASAGSNRKLQNALSAVVSSFCDHAPVAPFGLCRLAAVLRRQLASCSAAHALGHGSGGIQDAVLGELILNRWLLPSLSPGLHARQDAQAAFGALSKSLMRIASGALAGASHKDPEGTQSDRGLDASFLEKEAQRLRTGLFDVLAARGEVPAGQSEAAIIQNIVWPQCFVCTVGDLAALGHALAGASGQPSPQVVSAAANVGVQEPLLRTLRTVPTGHFGTAVICWASERAPRDPAGDADAMRQSFARALSTDASGVDEESTQTQVRWMALLWRCLADSQALHGPKDGTLTAALQALSRSYVPAPSGGLSGQQLRLEALLSWLRPHDDPRLALLLTPTSSGPMLDETLLACFRAALEVRQTRLVDARRALVQLQVAEPLLEQLCMDTLRMLKDCARYKTQLLCSSRLQALWQHGAKQRRPSHAAHSKDRATSEDLSEGLDLCILSLPADAMDGSKDSSRTRSRAASNTFFKSFFGHSTEQMPHPGRGLGLTSSSIQVFETPQCPIHRVLMAGAQMDLETQNLKHNVKHETVRGLHQTVRGLQHLPLHSELLSPEPLGVGMAVMTVLELIVSRLLVHCQRFDPAVKRRGSSPESFGSAATELSVAEEAGEKCLLDKWPRPADVVRTDEQNVRDNAIQFLFSHLHTHIFPSEPTEADQQLSRQIGQLSWLEPRHLDISPVFVEMPQIERAMLLLRGLRTLRSPGEMLDSLAMAFRGLTESACVFSQAGIAEGNDDALGADVSLPLFILVILRANPPMLESVLTYIERFTPKAQLLTEEGYAHVQARAAVSFAQNATARDLAGLRPGEWEDFVGVEASGHPL